MNTANLKNHSHSADVRIRLYVNSTVLPITQLGPDFLILKNPVNHPPCEAEIALWIDGDERRWSVRLPDGVAADERKTRIAACR